MIQFADQAFEQVQNSHNPANVQAFLANHPYHLGALMSMVELYTAYGMQCGYAPCDMHCGYAPCDMHCGYAPCDMHGGYAL